MAGWRRLCGLFSNKEAVTILLWYVSCIFGNLSVFGFPPANFWNNTIAGPVVINSSMIMLYSILGLFADVFIGRYRLIQFSLWVQWITVLISTLITALLSEYHFYTWLQNLLFSILCVMQMLGESSFHVVAIQFGTDLLHGAPSDHLSAFIFWYFMAEKLLTMMFQWVHCLLFFIGIKEASISLGWNLFSANFVSVILCAKSCFMSKWFPSIATTSAVTDTRRDRGSGNSNPYHLVYHVLKFAKKHKCPIQRSALTYWEDEIPSRIDLGKSKYGGPFTIEEVENVKTFLQLIKVLISLAGILIASYLFQIHIDADSVLNKSQVLLIEALCLTATTGLLILCHVFDCFHKCLPSMLKRIGIGATLTTACVISILLIDTVKYTANVNEGHIAPYFNLVIPYALFEISYIVLTVSLLEFIIAQSPHTMKGVLIGLYYLIHYGLAGLFSLIDKLPCTYFRILNCSGIVYCIVITTIALLSLIMYTIVACKYKLRERDEVVNVHIFAEKYYETREDIDDSNSGYPYADLDA